MANENKLQEIIAASLENIRSDLGDNIQSHLTHGSGLHEGGQNLHGCQQYQA